MIEEIAQAEGITAGGIVIDINNDLLVMFDRGHLSQIAWNLVRNAWQHCQKRPKAASASQHAPATWATP